MTRLRTRHRLPTHDFQTLRKMVDEPYSRLLANAFRRRSSKRLSYRYRWQRLTSHEQVELRYLRKQFILVATLRELADDDERIPDLLTAIGLRYASVTFNFSARIRLGTVVLRTSINDFNDSDCFIFFRFLKADLFRLLILLNFPHTVKFNNRAKMSGEEVMLRGLYELASEETKHKISANVFGREWSSQSRAFSWFMDHIYANFSHLVKDNVSWWHRNGFFENSRAAIFKRISSVLKSSGKPDLAEEDVLGVGHFIDCNCLPCSVVGGGPAEDGANAMRWTDEVQRAFYNGWKSIHGLKHQTVDNAYGFTIHIAGPTTVRKNDLTLFRESDINGIFSRLQENSTIWSQCRIFGDSAYKS